MPQPRLVYPRLLEERSADGRMVLHLHDQLTLNLRKASVAARNFRVLEHEDGHEVTHFEGVVGPHHRIEPMLSMERSEEGLIPHMIHEIEKKEMFDIEKAIPEKDALTLNERSSGTEIVPAEVTIELFIVSDIMHFGHFQTSVELISYLCIHVNSVNMRYADTSGPKVKFLLVGCERDHFSTYRNGTGKELESQSTLEMFQVYAYGKRYEYGHPDFVFLITGYDAYALETDGTKNMNVLGLGYVGGLCTKFFVALGEDVAGTYSGMHTLTHEGGHVIATTKAGLPTPTGGTCSRRKNGDAPARQLTLNLRKASVAARNFRVLEHEDGREVTRFFDGRDLDRNLHEDEKQFATVHVTRTDNGIEVEGVVGPHHRIEPMRTMERSENGLIPHMIHEIEKKELVDIEKAIPVKGK
ncbi:hypothetical protein HPB51_006714 [Rhipicephalus microplus]|uniref:Metalloprotease n=1 Tax=Rhipicephalus microplus TaxID=6941 RepID=A0A9J6E7M9_RHIMP|nr:hypothetical protein HPB51_006714 [Rhipicephalus microplus]